MPGRPCCATRRREGNLQGRVQKEVEAWVHKKLPVLGGRTPLQAVNDPDGREIVQSLLIGWGNRGPWRRSAQDFGSGPTPSLRLGSHPLNASSYSEICWRRRRERLTATER